MLLILIIICQIYTFTRIQSHIFFDLTLSSTHFDVEFLVLPFPYYTCLLLEAYSFVIYSSEWFSSTEVRIP